MWSSVHLIIQSALKAFVQWLNKYVWFYWINILFCLELICSSLRYILVVKEIPWDHDFQTNKFDLVILWPDFNFNDEFPPQYIQPSFTKLKWQRWRIVNGADKMPTIYHFDLYFSEMWGLLLFFKTFFFQNSIWTSTC